MDPLCEFHKIDADRNKYRRQVCLASLNTAGLAALLTQYLLDYRDLLVSLSSCLSVCLCVRIVSAATVYKTLPMSLCHQKYDKGSMIWWLIYDMTNKCNTIHRSITIWIHPSHSMLHVTHRSRLFYEENLTISIRNLCVALDAVQNMLGYSFGRPVKFGVSDFHLML